MAWSKEVRPEQAEAVLDGRQLKRGSRRASMMGVHKGAEDLHVKLERVEVQVRKDRVGELAEEFQEPVCAFHLGAQTLLPLQW